MASRQSRWKFQDARILSGGFDRRHILQPLPEKSLCFWIISADSAESNLVRQLDPHRTTPSVCAFFKFVFQIEPSREAADVRDKIQNNDFLFPRSQPQPAPQLLNEYPAAVRDPLEDDNVDVRTSTPSLKMSTAQTTFTVPS